jgi:hypothetical protein
MASLTVKQTADSRIRMLPDVHTMFGKMMQAGACGEGAEARPRSCCA